MPAEIRGPLLRRSSGRVQGRWKLTCRYLFAQTAGRAGWFRTELPGEDLPELLILGERRFLFAGERMQTHQPSVRLLIRGFHR